MFRANVPGRWFLCSGLVFFGSRTCRPGPARQVGVRKGTGPCHAFGHAALRCSNPQKVLRTFFGRPTRMPGRVVTAQLKGCLILPLASNGLGTSRKLLGLAGICRTTVRAPWPVNCFFFWGGRGGVLDAKTVPGMVLWEHEPPEVAYIWLRTFKISLRSGTLAIRRARSGRQLAPDIQNGDWEWNSGTLRFFRS